MIAWVAAAQAASVVCDPAEARRIVADARVDEARAPVTHPWLVPGLARAAGDPLVAEAIARICATGGDLSVERADAWEGVGWAAYSLIVTSAERDGCGLVHRRVPVSIGISGGRTRYGLRDALPDEHTPLGDCDTPPRWRSEVVVAGERSPVRLVSVEDHAGDQVTRHLVVRRASGEGWSDQRLLDETPPRLVDRDAAGPTVRLAPTRGGESWVVLSQDRTGPPCTPRGGQVVWRWDEDAGRWARSQGREALGLLTREGLWRYAGDDGWMLILAQDDEGDRELLEPRLRRLQAVVPEPLLEPLASADFPKLNPGFYVIVPAPWPSARQAHAARNTWGIGTSYVKRAWIAVNGCKAP